MKVPVHAITFTLVPVHLYESFKAVNSIVAIRRQRSVVKGYVVLFSSRHYHVVSVLDESHIRQRVLQLELLNNFQPVVAQKTDAAFFFANGFVDVYYFAFGRILKLDDV